MKLINWVTDRLAGGPAIESLYDARTVAAAGITHVISLRSPEFEPEDVTDEMGWVQQVGLDFLNNPTHDDGKTKPPEWFQTTIEYVHRALLANPGNKVFVHCHHGQGRTPSSLYAVLRAWGTPAPDALEHVNDAIPNPEWTYKADADRAIKQLGYK